MWTIKRMLFQTIPLTTALLFACASALLPTDTSAVVIEGEETPLHRISALECRQCHMEIYEQWKGSMHAQSTALSDPIHRAFYKKVVGDPTKEGVKHKASGKYPICLQCHAPNAAQDKTTKLDAMPAYEEGVNCLVCHRLKKFKGTRLPNGKLRLGLLAYETAEVCQGPSGFLAGFKEETEAYEAAARGDDEINPHVQKPFVSNPEADEMTLPLESNPDLLKTSEACLGCHDKRNNPHGVPLCATGDEYIHGKTHVSCQSCHMPVSGGFADHSMGGGHDPATLRRALIITLDTQKGEKSIETTVRLRNQQPHNIPTGAPFRNITLRVSAYDADGNLLWENFKTHPAKEDPKAYFVYRLKDDKGNPAPPPKAIQPGEDTRLKPYERRELKYSIPAEGVALVRAELHYNLLWPSLKKKFDFLPKHLKESTRMAFAEKHFN